MDTSVETVTAGERELVESRQLLGDEHPDTLDARRSLASLYRRARRFDDAIQQLELAVGGYRQAHGTDHPDTLDAQHRLAFAYRLADRLPDAEAAYQEVLTTRTRMLGGQHPDTLATQEHLAAVRRRRWHAVAG